MSWEKIKQDFLSFIDKYDIYDIKNFNGRLKGLSDDKKGKYYECLCYMYFKLELNCKNTYKHIYLYSEIPLKLKNKLKLPDKDKGIDCIAIDQHNKIFAVQVKYRSNKKIIPFGELATFPALAFGTAVKIDGGIFFSNCVDVCEELKGDKYSNILLNALEEKCDNLFWTNVREHINQSQITQYVTKNPLSYQLKIIDAIIKYYVDHDVGRLYLACGTGKTFLAFWSVVRELHFDKIFIVVPSLYLLSQTYETWIKETQYDDDKYHFILIGSDMDNKDFLCEYKPTTDENIIENELKTNKKVVVITTYHSSDLLINACKKSQFMFDFGIYDEAHRTVGEKDKCFTKLMSSEIEKKKMFMTATEKVYNYNKSKLSSDEKEQIFSMDNVKIYGEVIYRYSMRQAIDENVLVDYKIIASFINSKTYSEEVLNNQFVCHENMTFDIRTILTGLMIIMAMKEHKFKHLLIFSNNNNRAKIIIQFIEQYINKHEPELKEEIYCKFLSGNDNMNKRKIEVREFEDYDIGIISSSRIFGEGVDIQKCDAICFADAKSSSVDIIQYVGRCSRKCATIPDKISYVLVPFILDDDENFFDCENQLYLKLRKILKTIGTTDEMVTEKFVLVDCNKKIYKNIDKNERIKEIQNECEFDVHKFKKDLLTKVFDKSGDKIDITRNALIFENKKRYQNCEELTDTRKKCLEFLKNNGINEEPISVQNWIKYCVGETLFKLIKEKYYYTKDEIKNACDNNMIIDVDSYKSKYAKDLKLPSYDYINNGFYYDMDPKFNLSIMLCLDEQENDF